MGSSTNSADQLLLSLLANKSELALSKQMSPDSATPLKPWIRPTKRQSETISDSYWRTLVQHTDVTLDSKDELLDEKARARLPSYSNNIENCIGHIKMPVGVIGPVRLNGAFAKGDFYAPLATTEAALVASYNRGAKLISAAGGCTTAILAEGVHRAPGFAFESLLEAGSFVNWIISNLDTLKEKAETTTRHGKLISITPHMEGENVYLLCSYTTGDAAGQNMVTIATEAMCQYIISESPIAPKYWFVEANFSGDKKASHLSFSSVRGRKATAVIDLPNELIEQYLNTTAQRMHDYWRMSAIGGVMSGSIGVQGHYANGLAALYIATGQDAACVSESATGITRMDLNEDTLRVAVTMPNIIVGTVGGGTHLPDQAVGLDILTVNGSGNARKFSEIVVAVCLAGELSIIGALCAHDFASAHKNLARG